MKTDCTSNLKLKDIASCLKDAEDVIKVLAKNAIDVFNLALKDSKDVHDAVVK